MAPKESIDYTFCIAVEVKLSFVMSVSSSVKAQTLRTIPSHKQQLSVMHDIRSLTNSVIFRAHMILLCKYNPVPNSRFSLPPPYICMVAPGSAPLLFYLARTPTKPSMQFTLLLLLSAYLTETLYVLCVKSRVVPFFGCSQESVQS